MTKKDGGEMMWECTACGKRAKCRSEFDTKCQFYLVRVR